MSKKHEIAEELADKISILVKKYDEKISPNEMACVLLTIAHGYTLLRAPSLEVGLEYIHKSLDAIKDRHELE